MMPLLVQYIMMRLFDLRLADRKRAVSGLPTEFPNIGERPVNPIARSCGRPGASGCFGRRQTSVLTIMYLASSEARNSARRPMSDGLPMKPVGINAAAASKSKSAGIASRCFSTKIQLGRIPDGIDRGALIHACGFATRQEWQKDNGAKESLIKLAYPLNGPLNPHSRESPPSNGGQGGCRSRPSSCGPFDLRKTIDKHLDQRDKCGVSGHGGCMLSDIGD